jgi:Xaa-Pro aminopeptidase
VGLQIHEAPQVNGQNADTMEASDVLTIEPGAYLPGFGGVRIEDTLLVTDTGSRCLTTAPRDLFVVG